MAEHHDPRPADDARSSVERLLERNLIDESGFGKPLSHRAATTPRTVEAYLKAGVRPRWMERVVEIDQGIAAERRRLDRPTARCGSSAGPTPPPSRSAGAIASTPGASTRSSTRSSSST